MKPTDLRVAGPAILIVAGVIMLLVGLLIGGGAAPRLTNDPGAFVRWGLPAAKLVVNLSAAVMAGSAVFAIFALQAGKREYNIVLDLASIGAAVLAISSGVSGFLTFLSSFNPRLSLGSEFGQQLGRFLLETELGRVWLITTIAAAVITLLTYALRTWAAAMLIGILSLATLIPMATQGHSGSLANHDAAVMALALHISGAAVWLGGLLALTFLRPRLNERPMRIVVERYSTIALVAFVIVTIAGVARTLTSITSVMDLASAYGVVLAVKIVALVVLGVIGALHRQRFIQRSGEGQSPFWAFVAIEFLVMGLASGAAAALARTPAPADTTAPPLTTPAEILTEAPLPPTLTITRWITSWDIDLLWALIAGFGIYFYAVGVRRLRKRGETWRTSHTVSWVAGMLVLFWCTSGPIAVYADYLHSVDALGRTLLVSVIPLLLVLGAPYQLAMVAITSRTDDSRGVREWIQAAAGSRQVRLFASPIVASVLFALVLWVTSATGLLRWTLSDPLGHELRIAVLLATGTILSRSLLRAGMATPRTTFFAATLVPVAPIVIGGWIALQNGLIAANWFGAMGRDWGFEPTVDQKIAGVTVLAGALPVLLTVMLARRKAARSA
ncbi:MAG: bifunctional copper resistance protein CopD/cytochrome c oxidase assembly protein [Actinobacteria bacterium]|nr:bifunctional copper resistance protein CopD/cytochrome c oxidase assembly protein [Actinomycetota bacterium]